MKELALHILDIFYNSVSAGASVIRVVVDANEEADRLTIKITDNGCGMDPDFLKSVISPFTTTRTTRKVGMGIPLFAQAAQAAGGNFAIYSKKGFGTTMRAVFGLHHIDRAPLGNMYESLIIMVSALGDADLVYIQKEKDKTLLFDTRELREVLGREIPLTSPDVMAWIKETLREEFDEWEEGSSVV